jgi:hypothetical protein
MGIKDDLNLEGDQYQWLGSLFYFGASFYSLYIFNLLRSNPCVL